MLSKAVILPYKLGSQSAKRLANSLTNSLRLKVRRIRVDGLYRPKQRSKIINYGQSQVPGWIRFLPRNQVLNHPDATNNASNKLSAFQLFRQANLSIPDFTTSREQAQQWINDGKIVVCRTLLNGHSGRGIILAGAQMTNTTPITAPLYVLYKKKRKEFRVHVFNGRVIDVSEKRKRRAVERDDPGFVRNLANGWVFCRDNIVEPEGLRQLALDGCAALGLDFGAADIIWNEKENKCYLLEINTAPGLEGTTLVNYTNACLEWINNVR